VTGVQTCALPIYVHYANNEKMAEAYARVYKSAMTNTN